MEDNLLSWNIYRRIYKAPKGTYSLEHKCLHKLWYRRHHTWNGNPHNIHRTQDHHCIWKLRKEMDIKFYLEFILLTYNIFIYFIYDGNKRNLPFASTSSMSTRRNSVLTWSRAIATIAEQKNVEKICIIAKRLNKSKDVSQV